MTNRPATLAALALLLAGAPARANRVGIVGKAEAGCGGSGCHEGGVAPMVQLSGPSRVAPGQRVEMTFTVRGGQEVAAGCDIATTDGVLAPADRALRAQAGELTHAFEPTPYQDGAAIFHFLFQAPDHEGTVTIHAAGNSVDGNQLQTGDRWALDQLQVEVAADGAADAGAGGAGGAGGAPADAAPSSGGGGGGGGGCHQAPAGHDAPWGALLLLGGLLAMRKRSNRVPTVSERA
jgi:hypothetical protein